MKRLLLLLLITTTGLCRLHAQSPNPAPAKSDTTKVMLLPDAGTQYLDENGKPADLEYFKKCIARGGYTFEPAMENGKLKSIQLKKTGSKVSIGSVIPDFRVTDIHGKSYTRASLAGKTIVLNFWFTQCSGCIQEMPGLNALVKKYSDNANIVFLAITYDNKAKVQAFLGKKAFAYNMVPDAMALIQQWGIAVYPTNIVADASGRVVYSATSFEENGVQKLAEVIENVKR